jgi:hypothetical protein
MRSILKRGGGERALNEGAPKVRSLRATVDRGAAPRRKARDLLR